MDNIENIKLLRLDAFLDGCIGAVKNEIIIETLKQVKEYVKTLLEKKLEE